MRWNAFSFDVTLAVSAVALAAAPLFALSAQEASSPTLAEERNNEALGETDAKEIAPGIVVRGERLPDKKINRYIYDMLRPHNVGQTGQYPRLYRPFCPSVIGFDEKAEAALEERMRLVAGAAGIAVDPDRECRPNMHLVRVEDGPEMIRTLRRKRARSAFGWMPLHERARLERLPGPAYSWRQTFSYSAADGLPIASGNAPSPFNEPANNYVTPDRANQRLREAVEVSFRHAFVLVEREALKDVTVTQLADYAVMRGLAQVREDKHRATARDADTILNLFDESIPTNERMPSIGRMDLAMLTALYAAPDDVNANRQRGQMVDTFRAVLEELD